MTDAVRPPLQARSRDAWERVLAVGLDLLRTEGYDAFTMGEICRRAGVSAPSIYARVDGRSGLFLAVYDRGMRAVAATEDRALEASGGTIEGVARAMAAVFSEHRDLLRSVIVRAAAEPALLDRGAELSRGVVERFASRLEHVDPERAAMLVRTLYTECSFRAMYGSEFWRPTAETDDEFVERLTTLARLLAGPVH
ncbi:helix-turn-helix domain-containing protein [Agromyces sp. PvR057]|uniref:TetR/AcrR family transcriptional regulator n=1 Tax=Agromyces sp. PvR057 TaxID=3156403 RepID=UPI003399C514